MASKVSVEEIRLAAREEQSRWLDASYELASMGREFCSVDIWNKVKFVEYTKQDERRFFASIHRFLRPLVESGLLDTELKTDPSWRIARRYYRKKERLFDG